VSPLTQGLRYRAACDVSTNVFSYSIRICSFTADLTTVNLTVHSTSQPDAQTAVGENQASRCHTSESRSYDAAGYAMQALYTGGTEIGQVRKREHTTQADN